MHNVWLIARHEYRQMVHRRAFLLSTLGIPLLLGLVIAIAILVDKASEGGPATVAYVDRAGLIDSDIVVEKSAEEDIRFIAYESAEEGRAAVEAQEVDALFVVPSDYASSAILDVYYWEDAPRDATWSAWNDIVRESVLAGYPEDLSERVKDGASITFRSVDGKQQMEEGDLARILLPTIAGILFMVAAGMSSGYLLQALVGEKENRTMEVLVSTVTPEQLIGGKALGLVAVTLTQLLVWIVTAVLALVFALPMMGESVEMRVPVDVVLVLALYFVPSFALLAGLMIAVSGMVEDQRHAQALSGPITLPFILAYSVMPLVFVNPSSPVLTIMTLFPMTSFLTVTMRIGFSVVPTWELVAGWVLLVLGAAGSIWAAARIFRVGMLRYGQRLELRQIVASLWHRAVTE